MKIAISIYLPFSTRKHALKMAAHPYAALAPAFQDGH